MRRLMVATLIAMQIGCAIKVVRDDVTSAGEQKVYSLHSFLWSFIPGTPLPPASELCPGHQAQALDLGMRATDVLLTVVTCGIYVPHRVQVTCSKN